MCYSRTEIAVRDLIFVGAIALLGTNDVRAQIPGFPLPVPQGNNGQQTLKKSVASRGADHASRKGYRTTRSSISSPSSCPNIPACAR